jgi:hypothetical protein
MQSSPPIDYLRGSEPLDSAIPSQDAILRPNRNTTQNDILSAATTNGIVIGQVRLMAEYSSGLALFAAKLAEAFGNYHR